MTTKIALGAIPYGKSQEFTQILEGEQEGKKEQSQYWNYRHAHPGHN